jgi:acyl-CoA synthetase (NDP forming)
LLDDPATAVIALYLEGLRAPERFRAAAARATQVGKPIVAFKVGRSEAGMRSAVSHTGALAGADALYDALFRQLGVIRATTFADLLDIPAALAPRRVLCGRRVAIVTSTGGAATLVADSAGLAGFEMPAPDAATAQALTALDLSDAVLDRNPIDVTLAGLRPDVLQTVINTLLASPTYDALIVIVGASGIGQPDLVARPVIEAAQATDKPLMIYVSPEAPRIVQHLNRNGVPAFAAPESCAAALAALLQPSKRHPVSAIGSFRADRSLPKDLPASGPLNEAESKQVFAHFGIPNTREFVVASAAEAEAAAHKLGDRVVLKVLSRHIAHKTEVGGVRVDVPVHEIARHCAEIGAAVSAKSPHALEGFLVQEMVSDGVEFILGFHRDPQLGAAVLLGMGGIATELFNDTTLRLVPITPDDAQDMIASLRSAPLLRGFRGRPRYDVDALARAIVAFSEMVVTLGPRLAEAEINPLFVLPEGRGVRAGDGLVILQDA